MLAAQTAQPSWYSGVFGVSLQFLHFVLPCYQPKIQKSQVLFIEILRKGQGRDLI